MELKVVPSKKVRISEDDDGISQLPDNILGTILSLLSIREAVRTCVLSTRWRSLWKTSVTDLVFDEDNMLNTREYSANPSRYYANLPRVMLSLRRTITFVNSCDQLLLYLNSDHKIEKLKVYFTFCSSKYNIHLDNWVRFAISRGVKEIDLYLQDDSYLSAADEEEPYAFPCDLLENGTSTRGSSPSLYFLRLAYCILAPKNPYFYGFSTIKILDLYLVNMKSTEHVQNLLSGCCLLEWLSLCECYNFLHFKIEQPVCPRLKYLRIYDCREVESIEINCIDLETLEYAGYVINFFLNRVLRLKTLNNYVVGMDHQDMVRTLSRLPTTLPQLETLLLGCSLDLKIATMPKIPTFHNLKHLFILDAIIYPEGGLSWIATFTKACPLLLTLELHQRYYDYYVDVPTEINRLPRCPHDHLKEFVMTGTCGYLKEIEIAVYLLNNAMALDKMTIDPRLRYYGGDGKWKFGQARASWTKFGRQMFTQYLVKEASPLVELLIL